MLRLTIIVGSCLWAFAGCRGQTPGDNNNNNQPYCGNGVIENEEQCDEADLDGVTCQHIGYGSGDLKCTSDCVLDVSGCIPLLTCGNGVHDGREQCEGTDVGGASCQSLGFDSGQLGCTEHCIYDTSACTFCGDGTRNGEEQCDGDDLGENTCADVSPHPDGNLGCTQACTLDLSGCHTCGNGVVEPAEDCDDGNQERWDGCDVCYVSEFQVNTYTLGPQVCASVSMAQDGSFVVVWDSDEQDGDGYGVFGQRFDINGDPLGPEFQVNTYTERGQFCPFVSTTPDGRFVVTWTSDGQDGSTFGVYGQRFDMNGSRLGSEFRVNSETAWSQVASSVSMKFDGGFVASWSAGLLDGDLICAVARIFDNNGNPLGPEFVLNSYTQSYQEVPRISMASDGTFAAVWHSDGQDGDRLGVFGNKFDVGGYSTGAEFQVNSFTPSWQWGHSISPVLYSGFVVVWQSLEQDGDNYGVFGQRFDAACNALGSEFQVNTFTHSAQASPSVASASNSSFVVVWDSWFQVADKDVFGQRYDSAGNPVGPEFLANSCLAGRQEYPDISMAPDGRFVVIWVSEGQDGSDYGVFAQRFNAAGDPRGRMPW